MNDTHARKTPTPPPTMAEIHPANPSPRPNKQTASVEGEIYLYHLQLTFGARTDSDVQVIQVDGTREDFLHLCEHIYLPPAQRVPDACPSGLNGRDCALRRILADETRNRTVLGDGTELLGMSFEREKLVRDVASARGEKGRELENEGEKERGEAKGKEEEDARQGAAAVIAGISVLRMSALARMATRRRTPVV